MDLSIARAMVVFGMVMDSCHGLCNLCHDARDKGTPGPAKEKCCIDFGVLSLPGMVICDEYQFDPASSVNINLHKRT